MYIFLLFSDLNHHHSSKLEPEVDNAYLAGIDGIVSNYLFSLLEHYATALTNKLIANINDDSFCEDGICYYTRCVNEKCTTKYCKYHLILGERKCTTNKPSGTFDFDLKNNLIPIFEVINATNYLPISDNKEENDIQILNRILNKWL